MLSKKYLQKLKTFTLRINSDFFEYTIDFQTKIWVCTSKVPNNLLLSLKTLLYYQDKLMQIYPSMLKKIAHQEFKGSKSIF